MLNAIQNRSAAAGLYAGTRLKTQSIANDRPFAADVHAGLIPEGESRTGLGVAEGPIVMKNTNVYAARTWVEFATQMKYLQAFIASPEGAPLQNTPLLQGMIESDIYQSFIDEIPDAWSDSDIETWLETRNHIETFPGETNPPNPWTGDILGSRLLSDMKYDVTVGDMDPAQAVEEYQSQINTVIDDARSS